MSKALPLEGVRVVNLGWVWAGPVCGQTLGFLGAEVLKVEAYARVDMTRNLPPFANGEPGPNRSLSNNACWAGNGSVSLNLKKPEAKELLLELIAKSDVVIENFGPGVIEKMGLGYEVLCKAKKDIVIADSGHITAQRPQPMQRLLLTISSIFTAATSGLNVRTWLSKTVLITLAITGT